MTLVAVISGVIEMVTLYLLFLYFPNLGVFNTLYAGLINYASNIYYCNGNVTSSC
jgi:hypothetical protein